MLDFFVIGDVTTDHTIMLKEEQVAGLDKEKKLLSLPFTSKIRLSEPPKVMPGGNAYTVSAVLSKLSQQVGLYTIVGGDDEGEIILSNLAKHNVDLSLVQKDDQGTNSSTILAISGDRVILSYHHERDYRLDNIPEAAYVYLTSIGENDKPLFDKVLAEKRNKNFMLVFAPGSLQLKEDYSDIAGVMEGTEILILNKEEAQKLLGNQVDDYTTLLHALRDKGPKQVVITDSVRGSAGIDTNGQVFRVGTLPVQAVDSTGAGDTFAATLCTALKLGKDMQTAMEWGAIHTAKVVCTVGCDDGIVDLEELQRAHTESRDKLVLQN